MLQAMFRTTALNWLMALTAAFLAGTPSARAEITVGLEVETDSFYDALDDEDGEWVELPHRGYVWSPRVDADWRPYSHGHWVFTGDHGWYWESDERFGWATYHYGRWHLDDEVGWVWVPGRQWGPAWVAWRHNDSHIGWAPLPPEAEWGGGSVSYVETFYEAPRYRTYWSFCEPRHITDVNVYSYIAPPTQTIVLFNQTRPVVNNYTVVNQTIINQGVPVQQIQNVTHKAVPVTKLALSNTAPKFAPGGKKTAGVIQAFVPAKPAAGSAAPLSKPKLVATPAQIKAKRTPAGLAQAQQAKATTTVDPAVAAPPPAAVNVAPSADPHISNTTKAAIGTAAVAGGAALVAPHLGKSAVPQPPPAAGTLVKKHVGAPVAAPPVTTTAPAHTAAQVQAPSQPKVNHLRNTGRINPVPHAPPPHITAQHKVMPPAAYHPTSAAGKASAIRHAPPPRQVAPAALRAAPPAALRAGPPPVARAAPPAALRAAPPAALRAAPPSAALRAGPRPLPHPPAAVVQRAPPPPPAAKKVVKKPYDPNHPEQQPQ